MEISWWIEDHSRCLRQHLLVTFSVEVFSKGNYSIQKMEFFPFPETSHYAQIFRVCGVVGVLHETCIGCQGGWECTGGGFESRS